MRALVIEDEPLVSMLIKENLAELGYESAVVDTEEAAVAIAREQKPDLITADVVLREGSGIEAVRRICGDEPVPTLFIVGWFHGDRIETVPHAAMLRKPFETSTFYSAVTQARLQAKTAVAA
jgi:two-component system, response regulator PdtaR